MNKLTLIVFSFPLISACSPSMPELPEMPSLPDMSDIIPDVSIPTPYKANIYQGSVLERFKVNQLKLGMSKAQVQDLIGSPSITDPFHNNQWDYINHSTLHQADNIHYRLVLTFKDESLIDINTKGIASLAPLTAEEKALEEKRLADEKAKLEAEKKAKIKAQQIAKEKAQLAAKAKAEAQALAEQKALEEKRLADEKAKLEAEKKAKIKAQQIAKEKAQLAAKAKAEAQALAEQKALEEKRLADEKAKLEAEKKQLEEASKPWYQFW